MKKIKWILITWMLVLLWTMQAGAASLPRCETPDYKVAFYQSPNYHIQSETGVRSGYGYDLMQEIEKHLQCTFSYVGYENTPGECVEMLRDGELDIYTAAKKTHQREAEFAFSDHPAISATTCMNVKRGNTRFVSGDYATYDGAVVGLLAGHTYNDAFLEFAREKGFSCEVRYYDTPNALSEALITEEVDALVDSYIRSPEDEMTIEVFGETPYYFMVRREDRALVEQIDAVIDQLNMLEPNWRTDLYNRYYGAKSSDAVLTEEEQDYLRQLQESGVVLQGVMGPDKEPYSWFEAGEAQGIVADMFRETARELGLEAEFVQTATKTEYREVLAEGSADLWLDVLGDYEGNEDREEVTGAGYRITSPYLTTTLSILRLGDSSGKISRVALVRENYEFRQIIEETWPTAQTVMLEGTENCKTALLSRQVDAILMRSYRAEKLANNDLQNRFRVDVVPNSNLSLRMGLNAECDSLFFSIWDKTLRQVAADRGSEITQRYLEKTYKQSLLAFLYQHPGYFVALAGCILVGLFCLVLWIESNRQRRKQKAVADQLARALEEVKTANNAKSAFLFSMSHDIRTPMNAIVGYTDLILKHPEDQKRCMDYLRKIRLSGDFLLSLINNVLEMARIESNRITLDETPIRAGQILSEVWAVYSELMKQKHIEFTKTTDYHTEYVFVDKVCVKEIFLNLVSNAYKYTPEGGRVTIEVRELPGDAPDRLVMEIVVADTGIGMAEDFLPHLFEEFSREKSSGVSEIQGTGLGMPIVKHLVELMNGTISVSSRQGEGTTFVVRLPLRKADMKDLMSTEPVQIEAGDLGGHRILMAEDNDLNAEIAVEILGEAGLEVERAADGIQCVDMLQKAAPGYYDLILMDVQMPHMNGYEATRRIRAGEDPEKARIPIIAMTANAFEEDRRNAFEAGMNEHVAKPIDVKKLMEVLAQFLSTE